MKKLNSVEQVEGKKVKKPLRKRLWVWIAGVVVAVNIFGGDDETSKTEAQEPVKQEEKAEEVKQPKVDQEAEEKKAQEKAEKEAKKQKEAEERAEEQKELKYMELISSTSTQLGEKISQWSIDIGNYSPYNEESKINLSVSIVEVQFAIKDFKESGVEVPEKYKEVDNTFNQALDKYDYVMSELPKALDDMDNEKLMQLIDEMEKANALVAQTTEQIYKAKAK